MEQSLLLPILLQVILIALNAVFACAEIAVISMNDKKLARMAAQGDKRAVRLARLTSQPARFLATIQVAITLSGFLGSAFAADNFAGLLTDWLLGLGAPIPADTLNTLSVILITLILSYFTLVFGELVPKRVAMKKAEQLALGMSAPISFISKVFKPIVWLLTASTNLILRLLGLDPDAADEEVSEEDIRLMVDAGREQGAIDPQEQQMIQNIFEFDDLPVAEFATHRTDITVLWMEDSEQEWDRTIKESRHSMYPVCGDSIDQIVGILNCKDYFRLEDKSRQTVLKQAVDPACFIPGSVRADVLFRRMQQTRTHFAVVLDEYGGVQGIVTMNDLMEQLVGDLDDGDETQPQPEVKKEGPHDFVVTGNPPLEEVERVLGISLPGQRYDTFGGLVFGACGIIPEDGEECQVTIGRLQVHVTDIKEHRLQRAEIHVEE